MNLLRKLIATGLGTGYLRPAPGSWGSLGACVVYLAVAAAAGGFGPNFRASPCPPALPWALNVTMAAVAVLSSIGCVAMGRFAEETFGRKDPSQCTIDEWAGQAVTLLFIPLGGAPIWLIAMIGFFAFRFFDIFKIPPANWLERLPFGWGVLLDDIAAGIYANIATRLTVVYLLPRLLG